MRDDRQSSNISDNWLLRLNYVDSWYYMHKRVALLKEITIKKNK